MINSRGNGKLKTHGRTHINGGSKEITYGYVLAIIIPKGKHDKLYRKLIEERNVVRTRHLQDDAQMIS